MKTLDTPIEKIGFAVREKRNGRTVGNRCGRDFLYYALNYFFPEQFNSQRNNPSEIEARRLFGLRTASSFAWTQLQFLRLPTFLKKSGLTLAINSRPVLTFVQFVRAIIFSRISFETALEKVRKAVDEGKVAGIDISMGWGGLLDHVLFVYGYDEGNLYVCDTHKTPKLDYEKIGEGEKYLMRLSYDEIQKRWTKFGRVWIMEKLR